MRTKRAKFTVFLPSTPCTPEMREAVVDFALKNGKSLSEVQRQAMSFFLEKNATKAINSDNISIQEPTI